MRLENLQHNAGVRQNTGETDNRKDIVIIWLEDRERTQDVEGKRKKQ